MRNRTSVVMLLTLFCGSANAALYSCADESGSRTFRSTPCENNENQKEIKREAPPPSYVSIDATGERATNFAKPPRVVYRPRAKQQRQYEGEGGCLEIAEIRTIKFNQVQIGMASSQVYQLLGSPLSVRTHASTNGQSEQLGYEMGNSPEEIQALINDTKIVKLHGTAYSPDHYVKREEESLEELATTQEIELRMFKDNLAAIRRDCHTRPAYIYIANGKVTGINKTGN